MEQLMNIFKLLSDETRLRLLVLLFQEELCVCELSEILDAPQPRISRNLAKLKDLSIVNDQRKERFMYYSYVAQDPLMSGILERILTNLEAYPQLKTDCDKLAQKERRLPQNGNICTTKE